MITVAATSTRVAGRFFLEAVAGEGGMGTVYRAHDEQTSQTVALKLIRSHGSAREVERFACESALLSTVRHPGIVAYVAHGVTESGEPYLAMEWLEGEDLSKRLDRGALGLVESVALLRRAAEGLATLHEQGVVHRDIKPSNLFLRGGKVERLALLDLGIARQAAVLHALTRTGAVMGTPAYMAPEQARGERDLTAAADVFSLGCVLFECLTGKPPFVAEQPLAVLAKILFEEPPKLCRVRPEMPGAVEALLGQMLAKSTVERLPDATAVLTALTALDGLSLDLELSPTASALPSRLVDTEQHLISVLIAAPPEISHGSAISAETVTMVPQLEGLFRALREHGARVEVLADGSLVATLIHTSGVATDQATLTARCALLIKSSWAEATIALSTGRGLLHERLPVGEVLERAAALLRDRSANPETSAQILLDEVTRGLLEVRFRIQRTASGGYALSGEDLLLDANRPLLGKPTPCVGRDVEIAMLEGVLAECIEEGEPRAVLVTAPPGAGKSRLRHELLRRVEARDGDVLILIGRGDPMSAGSSYGLLGQALRRLCGMEDSESLEARRRKLTARLGERLPAASMPHVAAFLGELCGAPFPDEDNVKLRAARQDPRIMSDQITQAMLDFLRVECEARPVLLVLEDLHWGDALTVKLCETALRKLKASALMVLALARPEVDALFPRLWSGAAQVLRLRPLGKKAGERLVEQVLGKQVPRETVARIVEQSEGNALFLEELIRAVAEGRGDEAPETVLVMLQARIGRLEGGARRVLRAASVFGETSFRGGILALVGGAQTGQSLEGWLARLTQDEILEQHCESRFPEEQAYRFRHALMRDAAYGLLTEDDRALSHRLAGQYLEGRGEPDALVLAEHFLQGEEPERAIHYYIQAAEQSYETNNMDAALLSAERGLGCGAAGGPRGALLSVQVAVYLGRERYTELIALGVEALSLLPEGSRRWCRTAQAMFPAVAMTQQAALFEELLSRFTYAEPSADARAEDIQAASWLSVMLGIMGMKEASRGFLERTRQVGAGLASDPIVRGYVKGTESNDHHVIEESPWSCMLCTGEGREALRAAGDQRNHIILYSYYGKALLELGEWTSAEASLREDLAEAEQLNEAFPLTYPRVYLARLLAVSAPLDALDEPIQLAREVIAAKNMSLTGLAYGVLAEIKRRRGDLPGAEVEAHAACEAVRPFPGYSWEIIALRMRILLEQGRAAAALSIGEEAVQHLERLGLAGCGEIALRLAVAEARHAVGQVDAARAMLADTIPRVKKRVDDIPDAAARARYLAQVPTNARLLALAKAWLGEEAVHPSQLGLEEGNPSSTS